MHFSWKSLQVWVKFLERGWSGLVLLKLLLLTLSGSLVALSQLGACCLVVVLLYSGLSGWGGGERGHQIRKARSNTADAHDAADVSMYRDSCIAVMEVLDCMIRNGVSLACLMGSAGGQRWDFMGLLFCPAGQVDRTSSCCWDILRVC